MQFMIPEIINIYKKYSRFHSFSILSAKNSERVGVFQVPNEER